MRVLVLGAVLAVLAGLSTAETVEYYRGFKLLSAWPQDDAEVGVLQALGQWHDVDMFTHRPAPGRRATLLVPPASLAAAQKVLDEKGIRFDITNHDVQESVNAEAERQKVLETARSWKTVPDFERYMRYDEIQQFLRETASANPDLVSLQSAGKTFEGRDMTVLRISKNGGNSPRAVFVDAGIHAREWIAPPVAIYLIQQLVQQRIANANMLDGLDWYILPLVNADGYEYSHTRERFWRKNRSTKSSRWCPGIDLNRNFGFHFGQNGVSRNPCSDIYAGSSAFSEVEARNLRDYITKANANKQIKMYLTLHSYGPMILYPWGYDYNLPDAVDRAELVSIANEANDAIIAAGSEPFTVQNSADFYPAAGASDDWSKGVAGIAKAYTIELQEGGENGFDMPPDQIIRVVTQVFQGLKVFANRAKKL